MLAVKAGVVKEPVVPVPPPPDETQEVLLLDVQLTVDVAPLEIEDGAADSVTVGTALAATVTVVLWIAVPPGPVHVTE